LLFNADYRSMDRVVDLRQVGLCGTLSHTSKFVIYRTVAKTDPSFVGSKIRHWNASQVGANGRAYIDHRVTSIR